MPQDPGVSVLSHVSCRHDRRQEGHGSFPLKCHQKTCGPIRPGFRVRFPPSCSLSIHRRLSIRYRSGLQGIEEAFHRVRKRLIPVVTGCILGRFDHSGTKPDSFERWTRDQLDQNCRIAATRVAGSVSMAAGIETTGMSTMPHATVARTGSSTMGTMTPGVPSIGLECLNQKDNIHPEISLIGRRKTVSLGLKFSQDEALDFEVPELALPFDDEGIVCPGIDSDGLELLHRGPRWNVIGELRFAATKGSEANQKRGAKEDPFHMHPFLVAVRKCGRPSATTRPSSSITEGAVERKG